MKNFTDGWMEKSGALPLLTAGICFGHLWMGEFLAFPEWWFVGVCALIFGAGCAAAPLLPERWRDLAPALVMPLILLMKEPDWRTISAAFVFGIWLGGGRIAALWRPSRSFCGGILLGGVLIGVGMPLPPTALPVLLCASMLIYAGIRLGGDGVPATIGAVVLLAWCWPRPEIPPQPEIDPGTVITAFAAVTPPSSDRRPRAVFIGGSEENRKECYDELAPACDLLFFPELPGVIPEKRDLIVAISMPPLGDGGAAAMLRALNNGGVLVLPVRECGILPEFPWYILPGSRGAYAICAPDRQLTMDPAALDENLARLYRSTPDFAPLPGALEGELIRFRSRRLSFAPTGERFMVRYLISGCAALLFLVICLPFRRRDLPREKRRIVLNCFVWTVLSAMLIQRICAGIVPVSGVYGLIGAAALMWFFRRPVDARSRSFDQFAGFLSLLLLIPCFFFGSWIPALAALLSGGYYFASLDGELCGARPPGTEPLRFAAVAAGALAVFAIQRRQLDPQICFAAAALLRAWTWFRS